MSFYWGIKSKSDNLVKSHPLGFALYQKNTHKQKLVVEIETKDLVEALGHTIVKIVSKGSPL